MAWFLQGPVDGREVASHDEIVPGAKTMTPRASARNPTDFVRVEGTVWVTEYLIDGLNFTLIDF